MLGKNRFLLLVTGLPIVLVVVSPSFAWQMPNFPKSHITSETNHHKQISMPTMKPIQISGNTINTHSNSNANNNSNANIITNTQNQNVSGDGGSATVNIDNENNPNFSNNNSIELNNNSNNSAPIGTIPVVFAATQPQSVFVAPSVQATQLPQTGSSFPIESIILGFLPAGLVIRKYSFTH